MKFDNGKKVNLEIEKIEKKFDTKVDLENDVKMIPHADVDKISEKSIKENICNSLEVTGLTDKIRQGLASVEVGQEKTKRTELLKKVKTWVDKDNQVLTRRKQMGRLQKSKHHRRLQVFGGPTILRPRHRTAKKAKVLLDFVQCKGWVKKVKRFQRQRQGGEQRAKLKQELARAKVLAWLDGIEVEYWKSQMLHVLGRAV